MAETLASLSGVTRVYPPLAGQPEVHALGPVDVALHKGEFCSVVGPTGCGKSTLLDVLAGLSSPTQGTARFEGQELRGRVPEGIGVVFREDSSFPWLSVSDNVAFGIRRAGAPAREVRARVDESLAAMGLRELARAYPAQLSPGTRQRVCLARALATRPRLLLLDEPFGGLEAQARLLMGDELLRLWRATGATVLLVTRALDEAAMLSDRVLAMSARPGRILAELKTGWRRERDSRIVADPVFGRLTAALWTLLRDESLKALAAKPPADR